MAEGALWLANYLELNRFVSPAEKIQSEINIVQSQGDVSIEAHGKNCRWSEMFITHPYLMYVKKKNGACTEYHINKNGFRGPEYPLEKDPNTFTIMFAGSSVAEDQMGYDSVTTLEQELNENYEMPGFKKFKVLVGAMAAWRQPNQMIVMALNSNIIDGYISFDGLNEFELIKNPNYRMAGYPSDPLVMQGIQDPLDVAKYLSARCDGLLLKHQQNLEFLRPSYLYYYLIKTVRNFCKSKLVEYSRNSEYMGFYVFSESVTLEEKRQYNEKQFLNYIRNTSHLAKANKIKELHIIQPLPAFKKELTNHEKLVVGDFSNKELFVKMAKDRMSLNKENIPVVDFSKIFENQKEEAFKDFAHLNLEAKKTVNDRIIKELQLRWGIKKKKQR